MVPMKKNVGKGEAYTPKRNQRPGNVYSREWHDKNIV